MISDKTVELLTRTRELCEKIVEVDLGENDRDALFGTVRALDVLTDIMSYLMSANSMEQAALMARNSDFRSVDEVIGHLREMTERLNSAKENMN